MAAWAVARLDEIPELESSGECSIRPVRHHLGITAFGVTAWTAREAGERVVNEHEEDTDEELYVVLRGRAVFELDGERRDAPEGTLVYVAANVTRTAFAEEAGTTVLAMGGTPGKAYDPVGWELWYPLRKRYEAGAYVEVVARGRELVAAHPASALLLYNLACCESLAGETAEAVDHLRRAVEGSERFREYARGDSDLDPIRDEPEVRALLEG